VRVDIVIPAHNEEGRIGRTLASYRQALRDPELRFVVALDLCDDGTADVVERHRAADPRVDLLAYPKLGKGGVIMETFRRCGGDLLGFVDADCATPPQELWRLVEAAAHADGAIASRHHPSAVVPPRKLSRRLASAGFAFGVQRLFGLPYDDTQCGAKVLRREVVERAVPLLSSRDFVFDVDLLLVARRLGFDIVEVPTVWVDQDGSRLHAFHDSRRMAWSLLRLWLHHHVLPIPDEAASGPLPPPLQPARTGHVIELREAERVAS
jgi:glycosyltransferase involved in cell wall biosynthesis